MNIVKLLWLAVISDIRLQSKFEVVTANNEPSAKLFLVDLGVLVLTVHTTVNRVFATSS